MRSLRAACLSTLACWLLPAVPALSQETLYVTDVLQLGMHAAADTSDEAFRNLVSGTQVTVLERATDFARVRTTDGAEGWVRSFYLVAEQPARTRIAELESRVEALEQENQAYFERFERYRGTVPWPWVLGVVVVALGGGFLAGYWWLDATIRRRYGGFKVY
jgi:uncharacterized protein YgiM (DUF1202 family)